MTRKKFPPTRLTTRTRLGAAAVAACFAATPVWANPSNPTVVSGSATFNQSGNTLTVTNSNGAIINWQQFNINAGERTHFEQASASSSVLNRVIANDPSVIYGTLSSNGRVWLINPAGIMVGSGGMIDTAGFVASTLSIRNEDFLANRKFFSGDGGSPGNVLNQGTITTPTGGSVFLVGQNVTNEGIIRTPQGEAILAAGTTVSLIDSSTPGVKVDITGAAGNATNLGEIAAEAGRIGIAGVLVKNSGTLNASSVVSEGGRIFLKASQDAYVDGNGRIVTTGTKGGKVEVLGNRVAVMDNASIDVSGETGGGTILVGGDYQGKNPDVQNAAVSYVGQGVKLAADAVGSGNGGKIVVWADDTTRAFGAFSARGGALGGDGGLVETSGHRFLDVAGARVDTRASLGMTGNWLLDPTDITINHATGSVTPLGGAVFDPGGNSTTSDYDINSQLATTSVTIQTSGGTGGNGDITMTPGVDIHNATQSQTFTLNAARDITIYGSKVFGTSLYNLGITLTAGRDVFIKDSVLETYGGAMNISGVNVTLTGDTSYGSLLSTAGCAVVNTVSCRNFIGIVSGGSQTIAASGVLKLEAPAAGGRGVGLVSGGGQTISANSIQILGGTTGQNNGAHIVNFSTASQNISTNSLLLKAGGSATTDFNNQAQIYSAYGDQVINMTGANASITLYGGAGGATYTAYGDHSASGASYDSSCATYGGNAWYCYSSNNRAEIRHQDALGVYGQNISFAASGASINLYGGSDGAGNGAEISNDTYNGVSPGAQVIGSVTYGANIYMKAGSSGGKVIYGVNTEDGEHRFYDKRNAVGIEGDSSMTLYAGTITLDGGSATMGGAIIGGGSQNGGGTMNIYATGNVNLQGGTGGATAAINDGTKFDRTSTVAAIGSDKELTLNLTVGGNLNMTSGAGLGGGTLVGLINQYAGAGAINVNVTGSVNLTSSGGGAFIGSLADTTLGQVGGSTVGVVAGQGIALTSTSASGWGAGIGNLSDFYGGSVSVKSHRDLTMTGSNTLIGFKNSATAGTNAVGVYGGYGGAYTGAVSLAGYVGGDGVTDISAYGGVTLGGLVYGGDGVRVRSGYHVTGSVESLPGGNLTVSTGAQVTAYGSTGVLLQALAGDAGTGNLTVSSGSSVYGNQVAYLYSGNDMTIHGSVIGYGPTMALESGRKVAGASGYGGNIILGSSSVVRNDAAALGIYSTAGTRSSGSISQSTGGVVYGASNLTFGAAYDLALGGTNTANTAMLKLGAGIAGGYGPGASTYGGAISMTGTAYGATGIDFLAYAGTLSTGGVTASGATTLTNAGSINITGAGSVDVGTVTASLAGQAVNIKSGYNPGTGFYSPGYGTDLGTVSAGGGTITVDAGGAIKQSTYTSNLLRADNVNLTSYYGGTASTKAISADVKALTGLNALVDTTATYGGINIKAIDMVSTNISLIDNSLDANVPAVSYTYGGGDIAFTANHHFRGSNGFHTALMATNGNITGINSALFTGGGTPGNVLVSASGNLALSAALSLAGTDIQLVAGGSLPVDQIVSGKNITIVGGTVPVTAAVTATGGSAVVAGGASLALDAAVTSDQDILLSGGVLNLNTATSASGSVVLNGGTINVSNGVTATDDVIIHGSAINIGAGKAVQGANVFLGSGSGVSTVNVNGSVSGTGAVEFNLTDLNMYGGSISAGTDITGIVGGNITMNNGSFLSASNDIKLTFNGDLSSLYLMSGSYLLAGAPLTIDIAFTKRTDGGIFISGVGSGLFVTNTSTPAVEGAGLKLAYYKPPNTGTGSSGEISKDLSKSTETAKTDDTPTGSNLAPKVDTSTGSTSSGPDLSSTSGSEGSFGSESGSGESGSGDSSHADGDKNASSDKSDKDGKDSKDGKDDKDGKGKKKTASDKGGKDKDGAEKKQSKTCST